MLYVKVKTVSEDTKAQSNPIGDVNSDEKQNQAFSLEQDKTTNQFDPKLNRFECMSCGYIYDPDEGIKKLNIEAGTAFLDIDSCLLYTSPSPRDATLSRMPSSA